VTLVLIVLLVLLWGAVIVPTLLRARQSPASSVGAFRKNMQALGARTSPRASRRSTGRTGRWILGPPQGRAGARLRAGSRSRSRSGDDLGAGGLTLEQRRGIFFSLLLAAAFSLLLGFAYSLLLRIHLGLDVALLGYVVYLARTKPRQEPREIVTYHAPAKRRPPDRERHWEGEPAEWLRAGEL
jgi:hypothetical protein